MTWFKKPARIKFVALAADASSLVAQRQPSGDIRVDAPASVERNFTPAVATEFKQWLKAGHSSALWLFPPSEANGLSSLEAFLSGNIVRIVQALKGDSQILVAHAPSKTGGVVLCAGGEFSATPHGFRRLRLNVAGEQVVWRNCDCWQSRCRRLTPHRSRRGGDPQARRPSRLGNPPSVTAARRAQRVRRNGGRRRAASAPAPEPPRGSVRSVRPTSSEPDEMIGQANTIQRSPTARHCPHAPRAHRDEYRQMVPAAGCV
jgi:hypothetical protein